MVVASAVGENHAGIVLTAPGWGFPELVACYRDEGGWHEASSTSGRTFWSFSEDPDVGVLICWGDVEDGETALRITFHGVTTEVPVTNGHYVWLVEGVGESEIDDPAEFEPVAVPRRPGNV